MFAVFFLLVLLVSLEESVALRLASGMSLFAASGHAGMTLKPPITVAITGAAGAIGYNLLFRIANGDMLGKDQPVILSLIELNDKRVQDNLRGIISFYRLLVHLLILHYF